MDKNGCIGWDDEVSINDAEGGAGEQQAFVVLPDGEYEFAIAKVARGSFGGSANLPACNKVDVDIIVDGGDKGKSYIYKTFFMHTKTLGFIYEFLSAIGLHNNNEGATTIPWGKVKHGLKGRCKIITEEYYSKKEQCNMTKNNVKKWIAQSAAIPSDY